MGGGINAEYMGTHPIFESDFDCLTVWVFGHNELFDPPKEARRQRHEVRQKQGVAWP